MQKFILFLAIVVVLGAIGGTIWQYTLYKSTTLPTSCGGDFSYKVQCPMGTECVTSGQGPAKDGACRPYLGSVFQAFGLR